jgi:hypothetical protein
VTTGFLLSATARGLITLYASTLMGAMWWMVVPTIPVSATGFAITPGTAAQLVIALSVVRFTGMPISGFLMDRLRASGVDEKPCW